MIPYLTLKDLEVCRVVAQICKGALDATRNVEVFYAALIAQIKSDLEVNPELTEVSRLAYFTTEEYANTICSAMVYILESAGIPTFAEVTHVTNEPFSGRNLSYKVSVTIYLPNDWTS